LNAGARAQLEGATAVVTGASRGIGEAVARALAAAGAHVALVARGRERLGVLAAEIGGGAFAVPCDVADAAAVRAAAGAIAAKYSTPVRILVNNAGLFKVGAAQELSADDLRSMIDLNLVAPFTLIREFLPAMLASKRGHIVTIGSVADRAAFPGNAGYSASKFGARAVHEVLRAETKGTGVRATLVSPSATDTAIWGGLSAEKRAHFPKAADMLRADDVARAVLYAVTQPETVNVDELRLTRA
jgi:NADP-dependent 3-hydroxy acid dehydrogenase YdfG